MSAPDGRLFLLYESNDKVSLAQGVPSQDRTGWEWSNVDYGQTQRVHGTPLYDWERWATDRVISVYAQMPPKRKRTYRSGQRVDGLPSPLVVLDFQVTR